VRTLRLVRGEPKNHPPELLRCRLHLFEVERIAILFPADPLLF
jgi:hypothetical protein